MCLACPMRVIEIDGLLARCEARGSERTVSLVLLQGEDVRPGDHLVVHLGTALQTVTAEEARQTWALYDELLAAQAAPGSLTASQRG